MSDALSVFDDLRLSNWIVDVRVDLLPHELCFELNHLDAVAQVAVVLRRFVDYLL